MNKEHIPSLGALCRLEDPFADIDTLIQRLIREKSESRYLEWKATPPIGNSVTKRTKFRVVKAAVSFANTVGGFIIFGVDPTGKWIGISKTDLSQVDPASLTELFNSHISPDIGFGYREIEQNGRLFAVLHIPESPLMPLVITKEVYDKNKPDGKKPILLAKYAVYCRYGGKSDLANPTQFGRIITVRTNYLKTELLSLVKEVSVPIPVSVKSPSGQSVTTFHSVKTTQDPDAPVFRLTRNPNETAGVLMHEELSDGLLDEINNVLGVNSLLTKGRQEFVLRDNVYYRIYAERQHVKGEDNQIEMLARTGLLQIYGPVLYWLVCLPPKRSSLAIRDLVDNPKHPNVYSLLRIATLLGPEVSGWLQERFDRQWGSHSQPPSYYWKFQEMVGREAIANRRLIALGRGPSKEIEVPGQKELKIADLLKSPKKAENLLSMACLSVSQGNKDRKAVCRTLDILAYGQAIEAKASSIGKALMADA